MPEFSVPVANSTPSSPAASGDPGGEVEAAAADRRRRLRRDRRHRRPVHVAAVGGCGERSRKRAPNSSMPRSSSGSTPWRSASLPPQRRSARPACRAAPRRGRGTPTRRRRGGRAPTARCRSRRPGCACTPPSTRRSATSARLPAISKYCSVLVAGASGSASTEANECPVTGSCSSPRYTVGRRDAEQLVDRRARCRTTLTNWWRMRAALVGGDARGPVHDHRHVDAALVGVLLVPLERRVAALRPAPRVVGVAVRAADVVDALDRLVGRLEDAVEELHLVHHAERAALLRGAVVGHHDSTRVVELARGRASPSTNRPIWSSVWSRNAANASCRRRGEALLVLRQRVPRLDAGVARRQLGALGDHARARAGARTTAGGRRPSPRRTRPGTSPGTRPAPGAARGWRRTAR